MPQWRMSVYAMVNKATKIKFVIHVTLILADLLIYPKVISRVHIRLWGRRFLFSFRRTDQFALALLDTEDSWPYIVLDRDGVGVRSMAG